MHLLPKYPNKKSLLLYIHDGYGIENKTAYDCITPATPEEELALFKRFIAVCKGEISVQHDDDEIERRYKLHFQLVQKKWLDMKQNTPAYAYDEWNRIAQDEPKHFTSIFWDTAYYGRSIEELLKLAPLPERNTIPNINTGVGCESFLTELIRKGYQLTSRQGGNYLMTATLKDKKTSIRYCIYHAFYPTEARQTLFAWNMYADERGTLRIAEQPGDFTMLTAIDNMNVRPGWVGDFDICTKPRFNWEGALVEGSEKSAVYFMRGNTAAYFIADNPSYNVLPLARMLDQQLKKGLEQAPNTSEEKEEPQLERQDPIIYKDILWKLEYHNIAPPLQDPSLPNSFLLDDLAWVRGKVDPSYTWHSQTYNIYNKNGEFLYSISVYRHHDTDYLKAYMIKNYMDGGGNPSIAQTRRTHMQATTYSNNQDGLVLSGFMPGEFEIMPQFQKYPKKKSLLLYIHDGYGIENYTAYDRTTPATPEEELALFKRFIAVCKGEIPVQHDDAEIERRQKLYSQLSENRWHELEKNTTEYAQKEWNRIAQEEPRQFTRIFWDNANYGRGIERILKLEDIPERNTIPNVNTGVGCEPFLAELIQKGFQLTARKGGNYLMTATLKDKKTSIRYCIYHAFNPVDARQTLFAWNMYADERGTPRIVEKPGDFTMQAAIDNMNVRPGWVGDFDICTKPRFNWEGALVEGSEKSAVYFMRGNTAAYFIADNPSYDVRPLARMLDEQLKKGLGQTTKTSGEKNP
ncbi:hypothetical protein ICN84_02215 [Akkermansia glycaniphila]|uniref:hypothetical protein n=1 Tax=Akkermansia glycaniphila TaxID=1679444 RepID=UPI001C0353DA|nr:hypothetical protein [Akkermansia glycaniphila]MBT9448884.1 hypothetical protein [Akkermansia glycaniphila]